jgi:hypothetical protein
VRVDGEPFGAGPCLPLGFGALHQRAMVLGVASRDRVGLAGGTELLARVGARRLEQAIAHHGADVADSSDFATSVTTDSATAASLTSAPPATAPAASSENVPAKTPRRRNTTRSRADRSS